MLQTVFMFGLVIFIGFVSVKLKWIDADIKTGLSRIIIRITMPLLIFTSIASMQKDDALFGEIAGIIVWTFVILAVFLLVGFGLNKVMRLPVERKGLHVSLMTFGNVVFLAFPLLEAIFGPIGIFYAAFYHLAHDVVLWSVGRGIIDSRNKLSVGGMLKHLINPNIFAIILGLIFFTAEFELPGALFNPLQGLGKITTYLSLLFIGISMSGANLLNIIKDKSLYLIIIFKMLAIPLAFAVILFRLLPHGTFLSSMSEVAIYVMLIEASMPSMTTLAIIAHEVGADSKYASEAIFFTTLVSLATLPFGFWIMQLLAK